MNAKFPTHQDMLDEFAAGLAEHKAKRERETITVSPYLMREHVTYAQFMAQSFDRNQRAAS